jgi:hypothetical protein
MPTNLAAPVIITQPQDQSVPSGLTATFRVSASGSPAPAFQWWKNDTNLLAGCTSSLLVLTNTGALDMGFYSVVVSNSQGQLTSRNARLRVLQVTTDSASVPYTVSSTDLLQSAGTVADASGLEISLESGEYTLAALTDGIFNVDTNVNRAFAVSGGSLIYTFDTSVNKLGCTISNINTYGGWPDINRDAQNYTVAYATVAEPTNFIDIATISFNPSPGSSPSYTSVAIADVSGGLLASGVKSLRFTFGPQENGAAGYREFDVLGVAVPLPAIVSIQKPSGAVNLSLSGMPGQAYGLQRASTVTGPWTNIADVTIGPAGTASFSDNSAPAGAAFYRMTVP